MRIYGMIVFFHLLFVGMLFCFHPPSHTKIKTAPIVEKVIYYKEKSSPAPEVANASLKTTEIPTIHKKEEKKVAKSPPVPKKKIPKIDTTSPISTPSKKKKEIARALKSMAHNLENPINQPYKEQSSSCSTTQLTLSSEQLGDPLFEQQLISFLKRSLILPQNGSATIHFTLSKEGIVTQFKILNCDQEKNRHYLAKEVPNLLFPSHEVQKEYQIKIQSAS